MTAIKCEKDPLSNRTTNRIDFRPHSAHRPVFHKQLYKPTTAPLGDRTTHRVDFVQLNGKPATNQKPRDKISIDKNRRLGTS